MVGLVIVPSIRRRGHILRCVVAPGLTDDRGSEPFPPQELANIDDTLPRVRRARCGWRGGLFSRLTSAVIC